MYKGERAAMKKPWRRIPALLLAAALCAVTPVCAWAEETAAAEQPITETNETEQTIFDTEALQAMTEGLISDYSGYGLESENFSIAYTYLATGETWFYNPDTWFYSASMYKVPLMMILAEKEADGLLTQESDVKGLTLAYAEESVLVYSNNDYAHLMLNYLGTDQEAREMYKQFSSLPDDYYDSDFIDYSYFTARFMNDVMTTLYNEPERFPHIIDCLKLAQPVDYFHLYIDPSIEVAQKYGSYKDNYGHYFNHTSGIIYTQNPFILTVMTDHVYSYENAEEIIGRAAKLFTDYTLTLDPLLDDYLQQRTTQDAEETAAEETTAEAAAGASAEASAAPAAESVDVQESPTPLPEPVAGTDSAEAENSARPSAVLWIVVLCAVVLIAVLCAAVFRKKRRVAVREEGGGYIPKH